MRNFRVFLLPLFVLLTGCSLLRQSIQPIVSDGNAHLPALNSYVVYQDITLTPLSRLAVREAVKQWSTYTSVQIEVRDGPFVCVLPGCFVVYELDKNTIDSLTFDSHYIGYTFLGLIAIARDMPWDELQDTVIHEFGHMQALAHHPEPAKAVMNPNYGHYDHVMCDDMQQWYALRNLVVSRFCSDAPGAFDEAEDGGPAL